MSDDQLPPATSVPSWFGAAFLNLHPLLQQMHTHGGQLAGDITVSLGTGLAGLLGRRLARQLGVPVGIESSSHGKFRLNISHAEGKLIWARQFIAADGQTRELVSIFSPHGHYPHGYWQESTGLLRFRLAVDILDGGGWRWRPLAARLYGLPLPISLFPQSQAYKYIEDGQYRFQVSFVMPGLGLLLSYSGLLKPLSSQA